MPVIEITGASAVGKTTVIEMLGNELDAVTFSEQYELKKRLKHIDRDTFISNQLLLGDTIMHDLDNCTKSDILYIFDTGFFEILSYSLFYPYFYNNKWESFKFITDRFEALYGDRIIANKLICLDADYNTIVQRSRCDHTRNRKSLQKNYTVWTAAKALISRQRMSWISLIQNDMMTKEETGQAVKDSLSSYDDNTSITLSDYIQLFGTWKESKI